MTRFTRLAIPEVIELCPPRFGDRRGYFSEVYKRSEFEAEGLHIDWVQDNESFSAQAGTVRGLHCQLPPVAQDKLVRVARGAIFDVAVDLRRGSPSFGRSGFSSIETTRPSSTSATPYRSGSFTR